MKTLPRYFVYFFVLFCFSTNLTKAQNLSMEEVQKLVKDNAPIFYFHPNEPYMPSSVDWFLDRADLYKRPDNKYVPQGTKVGPARQHLSKAVVSSPKEAQEISGSGEAIARRYYLTLKNEVDRPGSLSSAKLYANVIAMEGGIGINYWIFYPYNGEGRVKVDIDALNYHTPDIRMGMNGTHEGDWERITLVLDRSTYKLKHVYMGAHGDSYKYLPNQLEFNNGQVVAYASLNGHGMYAKSGLNGTPAVQIIERAIGNKIQIQLLNICKKGASLNGKTSHELIGVSPAVCEDSFTMPEWVLYPYRWGEDVVYESDKRLAKTVLKGLTGDNRVYNLIGGTEHVFDEVVGGSYSILDPALKLVGGNTSDWKKINDVVEYDVLDGLANELNQMAFADGLNTRGPQGPAAKILWTGEDNEPKEKEWYYTQENIANIFDKLGMDISVKKAGKVHNFTITGKANKKIFKGNVKITGKTNEKNGLNYESALPYDLNCEVFIKQALTNFVADKLEARGFQGFGNITSAVNINWIRYKGLLEPLSNKNPSVKLDVNFTFANKKYTVKTPKVVLTEQGIKNAAGSIVNSIRDELKNKVGNPILDLTYGVGDYTINSANDFGNTMVSAANDVKDFFEDIGDAISCWFGDCGGNSIKKYTPPTGSVPIFYLTNQHTKRTIPGKTKSAHNQLIKLVEKPGENDFWTLLPYKDGKHYRIKSMIGEAYLANFGNKADKAQVKVTYNPGNGALWKMEVQSDGFFVLKNYLSGKYLATTTGHSLIQSTSKDAKSRWKGGKADYMKPSEILAGKGKIAAVLYYKDGYKGLKSYLRMKQYSKKEFAGIFPAGELMSIKVKSGCTVLLSANSGKTIKMAKSSSNLADFDFGDDTYYAKGRPYEKLKDEIVMELYEHENYKGDRTFIYRDGKNSGTATYSYLDYGVDSYEATSFKVTPGYRVYLHDNDEYDKNGKKFTSSVSDLDGKYESLDDDINKVRWEKID